MPDDYYPSTPNEWMAYWASRAMKAEDENAALRRRLCSSCRKRLFPPASADPHEAYIEEMTNAWKANRPEFDDHVSQQERAERAQRDLDAFSRLVRDREEPAEEWIFTGTNEHETARHLRFITEKRNLPVPPHDAVRDIALRSERTERAVQEALRRAQRKRAESRPDDVACAVKIPQNR